MQFIKPNTNFDFIGKRNFAYLLSAVLLLGSVVSIFFHHGVRFGIDFSGGTLIQARFAAPVETGDIKAGLRDAGISVSTIQTFGEKTDNEYLIRTDNSLETSGDFAANISNHLKEATKVDAEIRRVEMVGPQVGKDLRQKATLTIFYSMLFITIYISGRFEFKWMLSGLIAGILMAGVYMLSLFDVSMAIVTVSAMVISLVLFYIMRLKYAIGAIVALIHDVLITVGVFSIFDKEFSLPIIAALLTIIGYSLNDTIIVYDRIRENLKINKKNPLPDILNKSVNQTLSRTILTSGTTLITVLSLLIFGGGIIHDFAFAMFIGIITGTYSSIYVASPILLIGQDRK
jgi:preprotein translocase subunit SecF